MRSLRAAALLGIASIPLTQAYGVIESNSLTSCQSNSGFTAQLFDVTYTTNNNTLTFNINGVSTISDYVILDVVVSAYGYNALQMTINPCAENSKALAGICPMSSGQIPINSNYPLSADTASQVPSIAFSIPDLDGQVTVKIYKALVQDDKDPNAQYSTQLACVQANLSNGKTVYQKAVGWVTAVIAGLALLVSAIVSGLGHSNTATHVAANALSLFSYFQSQALFGMTAVVLPPIVRSWTQNFQWAMGIIHATFIQDICTWYQQSTGGTPSQVLSSLSITSVSVQKRSLDLAKRVMDRPTMHAITNKLLTLGSGLIKRSSNSGVNAASNSVTVVHGIERVGFEAGIELTNIFMTGYIFFIIFVALVILCVVIFRWTLEWLARSGKMKSDKFLDFRNGWTTVLRGIVFRLILIGFPQMTTLCFWEFVKRDSAGEIVLGVVTIITMVVMLVWACSKVWRLARRSIAMHKNPAYILYSDPVCLHKWGFLYVQFKAAAYWFIIPSLIYTFVLCLFVGLAQGSQVVQAVAFVVLNAALLIGVSILRPYMDKKTNAFNISIAAVNFASSVFLLFFTNIFGLPGLVVGVMGVIFFILNAVFALVLLILVLIATLYAIFSKNPDVRYQPMRDDRGSFIKSQSALNTELDALGATARGEGKTPFKNRDFDEDSYSGSSWDEQRQSGYQNLSAGYNKEGRSHSGYGSNRSTAYQGVGIDRSPGGGTPDRSRAASPWQRGAGYDR